MSEDPRERLQNIKGRAEELGIDGLFSSCGKKPEEMAYELWKLGYLKIPTVEELVSAMETEIRKRSASR